MFVYVRTYMKCSLIYYLTEILKIYAVYLPVNNCFYFRTRAYYIEPHPLPLHIHKDSNGCRCMVYLCMYMFSVGYETTTATIGTEKGRQL